MPAKKKKPKKAGVNRPITQVHRFKVVIADIEPPISRVVELPSDCTLGDLHEVLQAAFGWTNSHLHTFEVDDRTFSAPHPETPEEWTDEDSVRLDEVAPKRAARLLYEYDMGDSWEHELVVEKIGPPEEDTTYPRCVFGTRACPPEDCGGVSGYENLLNVLADPEHEEHADVVDWVGKRFDPEAFDADKVNAKLKRL